MDFVGIDTQQQEAFDDFLRQAPNGHFMQGTHWYELKSHFGWQGAGRYAVRDGGRIVAAASILKKTKLGVNILYIPRGPVWSDEADGRVTDVLFANIESIAQREKSFFVRISPNFLRQKFQPPSGSPDAYYGKRYGEDIERLLSSYGYRYSKKQVQTNGTLLVDLTRDEEQILSSFHRKTRYNIRLAEKKGVRIELLKTEEQLSSFYSLLRMMAERQDYLLKDYEYFRFIYRHLVPDDVARIYIARDGRGEIISGILIISWAGRSYYMYGGFDYAHRSLMPNYLIHWHAMREEKRRGVHYYDFQGVPLVKDESHPSYGFYRFKRGFSDLEIQFVGDWDYTRKPLLYWLWDNVTLNRKMYLQLG
jgi:peptidoglycan pentaglycine glycine transferase (the first glycine)